MKKVLVLGSLAYDYIMNFNGRFADHIMADKIHALSVCFSAEKLNREFGGTAGNIAYNLSLLDEKPVVFATTGCDFDDYKKWLKKHKIDISNVKIFKDQYTASAHIITDKNDNQITAFHAGAMLCNSRSIEQILCSTKFDLAIAAPDCKDGMILHIKELKKHKIPYIFDPGQALPGFSKKELLSAISGSFTSIMNDYEIELCSRNLKMPIERIQKFTKYLIITLGPKGSIIYYQNKKYKIPAAQPKNESDPTGAGDAYRAGIIKGLLCGANPDIIGKLGALCAVYTVEKYGTQTHFYTKKQFLKRYQENFKSEIKLLSNG